MNAWKTSLCVAAMALTFSGCILYSSNTDGSDISDNPVIPEGGSGLSGILVDAQGNPVFGAQMKAYPADSEILSKKTALASDTDSSQTVTDSAWTDEKGQFKFSHLKQGSYNIEGSKVKGGKKFVVCRQEVHFKNSLHIDRDTLKTPGSILIQVQSSNLPLNGAQCSILGTSFFAMSDTSGKCLFTDVPPGFFKVRMRQSGFLPTTSNGVWVESGKTTDAGTYNLSVDSASQPLTLQSSTVALWTFDSKSSNGFTDSSSNHFVLSGNSGYSLQSSPRGSAVVFDGTGGKLSMSNDVTFTVKPTGIITLEARIYMDQYTSTSNFGGLTHLLGTYEGLGIGIASDGSFGAGTQKYSSSVGNYWYKAGQSNPGVIPLHRWVTVAVAMDQSISPSQLYAYIDGKPVQLYGIANSDPARISTAVWTVGNSAVDAQPFQGKIDELRVSNELVLGAGFPLTPISPVDRISHFGVEPSTIALWTFNSFHNNMISDVGPNNMPLVSTNGHNGVADASLISASPNGSAIAFVSQADPLTAVDGKKMISIQGSGVVPSSASQVPILAVPSVGQITFEARIYLDQYPSVANGHYYILGMHDCPNLVVDSAGVFHVRIQKTNGSGSYSVNLSSGSRLVPLHSWVDVAIALDQATRQVYGYLNGNPVQLSGTSNPDLFRISTLPFTIGKDNSDGHAFLGRIDEVRVSNGLVLGAGLPIQ